MGAQLGKESDAELHSRRSVDRRKAERIHSLKNSQVSDEDRKDEIAASKVHWSQTVVAASADASKLLEDNEEHFRNLKKRWPSESGQKFRWQWSSGQSNVQRVDPFASKSFWNWHHEDLVVDEKPFARGGQADIFDAVAAHHDGDSLVLKVFKDGCRLQDLQKQWPEAMLSDESTQHSGYFSGGKYCNKILGATVTKNGRFAFVMQKCATDLRKLIDCRVKHRGGQGPPFPNNIAFKCMWQIAKGMQDLHKRDLIHRDLKAANVLIQQASWYTFDPTQDEKFTCKVADYESSVGVLGTGFWRAPEVLRLLKGPRKDRFKDGVDKTLELFTKQSDVYSYSMTSCEILTGKIPLGDTNPYDYDSVIIHGARPTLLDDIHPWLKDLLNRCWDVDPSKRPSFEEIVKILEINANCELE